MNKENYNSLFHTHTVSGIVISVALYIIFFAGSFTFFMEETQSWEQETVAHHQKNTDFDKVLSFLETKDYDLYGREIYMYPRPDGKTVYTALYASKDSLASEKAKEEHYLEIDIEKLDIAEEGAGFYSVSGILYYLHFFYQLPEAYGLYLAGAVALFFLFAIVTGVIIHWKKMISNFYLFRPKAKLKLVWSDAHTVLGVIGLPFQFMYAVTGVWFGIWILLFLPTKMYFYEGDDDKMSIDMGYSTTEVHLEQVSYSINPINPLIAQTTAKWENFAIRYATIHNYGDHNMQLELEGNLHKTTNFITEGAIRYQVANGAILSERDPYNPEYFSSVEDAMGTLHYGNFAGKLFKTVYFLLGLITCFVIISGVLIWLEARKRKNITEKQARFNKNVGHIYLAICLSMFPITAFSYIVAKVLPVSALTSRELVLNTVYFGGWVLLFMFFRYKRDNYFTNKYTLLSGGVLSLCIPIINGVVSGNWIWNTYAAKNYAIFAIDTLWLCIGFTTLFIVLKLKKK